MNILVSEINNLYKQLLNYRKAKNNNKESCSSKTD